MSEHRYSGLRVRGGSTGLIDPGTFASLVSEFTWFQVPSKFLGVREPSYTYSTFTPSELLQLWFGEDLSTSSDGESGEYRGTVGETTTTSDDDDESLWNLWRTNVTTAYMVTAVIGNLPPISIDSYHAVAGYLDWKEPWGLVYDADVLYKSPSLDSMTAGENAASTAAANEAKLAEIIDNEWVIAGDDGDSQNSVWPKQAYADLMNWYNSDFDSDLYDISSTYGLEAVGYDAYDTMDYSAAGGVYSAGLILDANESLHSNELFRFSPASADGEQWRNDPSSWYHDTRPSFQAIGWTYANETIKVLCGAYHAKYSSSDSYTWTDSSAPWSKTNDQEIEDMNSAIDAACDIIGPTLETTTFPKKFINHVQRKRKIPNNLVSAFGYVPGTMYTANTVDTYETDIADTESYVEYDPVTGDVTSASVPGGMGAVGADGAYTARAGYGEGYSSDGPDDTDTSRADWWDD
jgi:hypothetical protein